MSFDSFEGYRKYMDDPGMMARIEGATTETELLFMELVQHAFAVKDLAEQDCLDMAVQGSNELSRRIHTLDQEKAYMLIAFMLDQVVEQIHARIAPDGTLRQVNERAKKGAPLFVGMLSGWTLGGRQGLV